MLQFIIGTTGSGKTTLLRQKVCESVRAGKQAIVIVPEQHSFETEKTLYEMLGARLAIHAEVLSFTRLCNRIFRCYGGLAGDYIDDSARLLLMSLTLEELSDTLELYSNKTNRMRFVESMVSQVSEFKNAGITPEQLEQFAQQTGEEEGLAKKTGELASIYRVYQAMIDRSYKDAEDDITRACGYLESEPFFADYDVFIDSFKSFTAAEHLILDHIFSKSLLVTVTLCTDSLEEHEDDLGLFSLVKKTAARLKRIAKNNSVQELPLIRLNHHYRYQNDELVHLEQNVFRSHPVPYNKPCGNIQLVEAQNQYDEVEYVAACIREAVRKSDVRYRDIAVIGRDLSSYTQAFESVFERYEIPYFMDSREDITGKPLTAAVLHAVDAVCRNFDTDGIMALLKTALLGISSQEIGELENYCFVWDVKGQAWRQGFTMNPSGYGEFSEKDKTQLAHLNQLRIQIITPLEELFTSIQRCNGAGFAAAVFRYLEQSGILNRLRHAQEDDPIAGDCVQLYDTVVDLLDQFAAALGGANLTAQQYSELLRMVLCSVDIGSIPQTLDQVIIGSADRIRLSSPKLTFLVGANDGVFPAVYKSSGILSDAERDQMIRSGLEISNTAESKSLDETFCAYAALCSPSQQLTVCYACSTIKGESLYPSVIVKNLRTVLPFVNKISADEQDHMLYIQNNKTAFDVFCSVLRQDNQFTASLKSYLEEQGMGTRVQRLLNPAKASEYQLTNSKTIFKLYGKDISLSASRLDQFYQCKMAYFCRYGLSIKPRRRAELSPMESGTLVHFVLQALLSQYDDICSAVLDEEKLRKDIHNLLWQYVDEKMGGKESKPARFTYLFKRLEDTLLKLLQHLAKEFANSQFRPVYFELPIKKSQNKTDDNSENMYIAALEFPTAAGGTVAVEGVVDRVDVMDKNDKKYIRVVDYKSGSKTFHLTDIYCGLNLQMLIYLFTLRRNGQGSLAEAAPAGILYMPAKTKYTSLARGTDAEEAEKEQMKTLKMNGLLLDNPESLLGMERDGEGVFIPVTIQEKEKTSGKGKDKTTEIITEIKGDIATLAELGKLEQYVEKMVVDMANTLHSGAIGAVPTYTSQYNATCEYCDYREVCGHEEGDLTNKVDDIKNKSDFFDRIDAEKQAQQADNDAEEVQQDGED
ncbi:ATP-dependent helicase/nuclease subunit B [Hydrogenoanaerobacterium saccharovorans]|uniref:ATP-dependent helicase/nuclease subunit B n=1 Tax=Hydrogenoanaerobacterium saccharovorans TaxID=474960 RepID=A0A1H7ZRS0_9FIRM|nr:PD-(D/E)XK nuclease family protein [Hydrogenoanaerobacterium saccharovorans]RPF48435.1 ATP-dependent helicase/nuclease subunit B [Hydrogenoanaerobacterium saccharovorans]SEM60983.1 ATP-dependent helicase/nuclease subunit B [Hydrogenoanaerobacterium saccharovorans]